MPNRILKETICTSSTINELSAEDEAFFYRLIVQCDDFGRMDARPAIIRAKCYPLRLDAVGESKVKQMLARLAKAGLVQLYAVDGQDYLQMTTWDKHQQVRAKRSKYPAPATHAQAGDIMCNQVISDDSICPRNPIQSNPNPIRIQDAATPQERLILDELASVANYPYDESKDLPHICKLRGDFPQIDLLREAKAWATYKLDKPLDAKSNPRSQFRTWCSRAKPAASYAPPAARPQRQISESSREYLRLVGAAPEEPRA